MAPKWPKMRKTGVTAVLDYGAIMKIPKVPSSGRCIDSTEILPDVFCNLSQEILPLGHKLPLNGRPPDELLVPLELLEELHRAGVHVLELVLELPSDPVLRWGQRVGVLGHGCPPLGLCSVQKSVLKTSEAGPNSLNLHTNELDLKRLKNLLLGAGCETVENVPKH